MKKLFGFNGTTIHTLLIVGIIFLFVGQSLMASTINGKVTDRETKEGLPAANILIKGTSLGTAADLDGSYTIANVPPGTYTLVISYIGYVTVSTDVVVPASGSVEKDVSMKPEVVEGAEVVVVTAQAAGQIAAINQQISSNTITNIVSSSKIHELPDDNAATALSRLPGLSLQEGDKVVIRGVQARMNMVLVNGIQLPSTDMEDRSTNLGFISSNLLDGIEVTKVVTPDMDANAIGGVVNLRLREAPVGLHLDVFTQGTYNATDRTYPGQNYKAWASLSNRYLNNKLGVFLQASAKRSDEGQDRGEAVYAHNYGLGQFLPYGDASYGMSIFEYSDGVNVIEDKGGSIILDYLLPQGKIVFQNTVTFTNNDLTRHREVYQLDTTRRRYTVTRDVFEKTLFINALQGEFRLGDLRMDVGLSHSYSDKDTDLRYGDATETEFGFVNQVAIDSALLQTDEEKLALTPEDVYKWKLDKDNWKKATILQDGVTRFESYLERIYDGNMNLSLPVAITNFIQSNFKAGGRIKYLKRKNDIEAHHARINEPIASNRAAADYLESIGVNPDVELQFPDFRDSDYERGEYFQVGGFKPENVINTERLDEYFRLAPAGWPCKEFKSGSNQYDYTGWETYTAGYVMGDFDIGPRLNIITGVRFEHYNMNYDANFVFVTHPEDGVAVIFDTLNTVDRNDDDLFPNVQLRYKATDWFDIRAAYSKTVSRPDYNAILPNPYIQDNSTASTGNPKLKPTLADNLDLYFSFYNNKIGLFTVGGFYKELDNVFYQDGLLYSTLDKHNVAFPDSATFEAMGLTYMNSSATITTYINNPNPGFIRGLEFDWQTTFWYLPKPFNSMVLNINYTRAWSEMDYQQILLKSKKIRVGKKTETIWSEVDTVRNARLLYQGDHVLNIALGADYKGFSGRISFNLQGDVITSVAQRPEEDRYTGDVYKWDFTIQQELPVKGLHVVLSGVNVFNNITRTYQKFARTATRNDEGVIIPGPVLENLAQITYNPRRFELGVRYTF